MIEQFQGKRLFPNMATDEELKLFFEAHSNAEIVVSQATGLGKSRMIEHKIMAAGLEYVRVLISGEMTAEKFVDLHLEKEMPSREIGYHYDMHQSSNAAMVIFQALILKCVVGGDEKI
jgi:hypothetical protein